MWSHASDHDATEDDRNARTQQSQPRDHAFIAANAIIPLTDNTGLAARRAVDLAHAS